MIKNLYFYLIVFLSLVMSSQVSAKEYEELKRFCMWKASAAQIIAMNRDIGLNEVEVTRHYINQETNYEEQLIVLYLIDKIYDTYQYVTHDTVYSQTNKTCLRDFYTDKSEEIFVSQYSD